MTFEGSVGEPDPGEPVVLAVADASVLEGDRGTSNVAVAVTLSSGSSQRDHGELRDRQRHRDGDGRTTPQPAAR